MDAIFRDSFTPFEGLDGFVSELSSTTGIAEAQIWGQLANITRQSEFWTRTRARQGRRVEAMPSRFLFEIRQQPPPDGWVAEGDPRPRPRRPGRRTRRKSR